MTYVVCVPACPVDAVFAEEDLPAGEHEWAQVNQLYFVEKADARAGVSALAPAVLADRAT